MLGQNGELQTDSILMAKSKRAILANLPGAWRLPVDFAARKLPTIPFPGPGADGEARCGCKGSVMEPPEAHGC